MKYLYLYGYFGSIDVTGEFFEMMNWFEKFIGKVEVSSNKAIRMTTDFEIIYGGHLYKPSDKRSKK